MKRKKKVSKAIDQARAPKAASPGRPVQIRLIRTCRARADCEVGEKSCISKRENAACNTKSRIQNALKYGARGAGAQQSQKTGRMPYEEEIPKRRENRNARDGQGQALSEPVARRFAASGEETGALALQHKARDLADAPRCTQKRPQRKRPEYDQETLDICRRPSRREAGVPQTAVASRKTTRKKRAKSDARKGNASARHGTEAAATLQANGVNSDAAVAMGGAGEAAESL
ncbi:hypothetical protein C8R44DRAFT_742439 [Mycena epipterygia]|nr:hypothetical protein C8R44DRAFT_742439 [Mycena epipterygia]